MSMSTSPIRRRASRRCRSAIAGDLVGGATWTWSCVAVRVPDAERHEGCDAGSEQIREFRRELRRLSGGSFTIGALDCLVHGLDR